MKKWAARAWLATVSTPVVAWVIYAIYSAAWHIINGVDPYSYLSLFSISGGLMLLAVVIGAIIAVVGTVKALPWLWDTAFPKREGPTEF